MFHLRTQINFTVAIDFTSSNGKIALLFVLVFDKDLSNLQLIKPLLSAQVTEIVTLYYYNCI